METKYEGIALPTTTISQTEPTYAQDAVGRVYVASTLATADPGQAYVKVSKTAQTVDAYGNVTQKQIFDYGNLTTAARTFNTTFLTGTAYKERFILNRPTVQTVTNGTSTVTLSTITYDLPNYLSVSSTWSNFDMAGGYSNTNFLTRGNANRVAAYGKQMVEMKVDTTGLTREVHAGGVGVDLEPTILTAGGNNTVYSAAATGSMSTTKTYTALLGMDLSTGVNGATVDVDYDAYGRPTRSKSPNGAWTDYTYGPTATPPWTKATTNGKWSKTTFDGFGRAIKSEAGYGSTTVSITDTEYEPCACSPLAKLKRTSRPYAPGGTVYWTTSTYDALGRTIAVSLPNGAGTSTTSYQGNVVTVTDPAGKWGKSTTNAMGEVVQMDEPNPAGGANLVTTTTYDVVGHVTQTQQVRGA